MQSVQQLDCGSGIGLIIHPDLWPDLRGRQFTHATHGIGVENMRLDSIRLKHINCKLCVRQVGGKVNALHFDVALMVTQS